MKAIIEIEYDDAPSLVSAVKSLAKRAGGGDLCEGSHQIGGWAKKQGLNWTATVRRADDATPAAPSPAREDDDPDLVRLWVSFPPIHDEAERAAPREQDSTCANWADFFARKAERQAAAEPAPSELRRLLDHHSRHHYGTELWAASLYGLLRGLVDRVERLERAGNGEERSR